MKLQSNTLLPSISKVTVKNLTMIVEERLDIPQGEVKRKKFTAADLWMIEKQRRIFQTRRYL